MKQRIQVVNVTSLIRHRQFTRLLFMACFTLYSIITYAASGVIKGKVTDSDGYGIAGVNVIEKGTTNGVITDVEGNYMLNLTTEKPMLSFSFIGYKSQDILVGNKTVLNIILKEDVEVLEEVVVVGYGSEKKVNLTGSVANINMAEMSESRPITDVSQGLAGMAAGVQVTSSSNKPGDNTASIMIRGQGTLNNSAPLVIIDGVEGSLNSVQPQDIENLSVLKDAASAAIYGSRAANGVILITTRSGKQGKTKVDYNGYLSWESVGKTFDLVSNYADYMELINEGFSNSNLPTKYSDDAIKLWRANEGKDALKYPNTSLMDELFKTSLSNNHSVSISGGSDKVKFYTSFGFLHSPGVMDNSGYKKTQARVNLDIDVTSWLKVGTNINGYVSFTEQGTNKMEDVFTYAAATSPGMVFRAPDGRLGSVNNDQDDAQNAANNPIYRLYNTAGDIQERYVKSRFYGTLTPFKGFTLTGSFNYMHRNKTDDSQPVFLEQWNFLNDVVASTGIGKTHIMNSDYKWNDYLMDVTAAYQNKVSKLDYSVMVGASQELFRYKWFKTTKQDLLDPGLGVIDGATGAASSSGNTVEWVMRSYFSRLKLNWDNKYLFEVNLRADGSSRFMEGNRWGYFPSFSGAWRISEEEFMESTHDWLSSLKIRASWGMLGNQDALNKSNPWENQYYPWMQTYNLDGNYPMGGNLTTGYYQKAYRIEDLSWEKSTTWGIGLDAVINHVTFTFDYYDRKTTDIIMEVPVPTEFGLDPYFDNVGSMRNRGVEVQLGYNNKWNDWSLNVMGNMAYNKNKIEDLGGVDRMTNPDDGDLWRFVGKPIDSYYVYKADGFFQSDAEAQQWMDTYKGKDGYPFGQDFQAGDLRYVDTNGDGKLDADDRVLSKTINPVVTFGLNLNVGYKAFDLTLNFTGAANVGRAFTKEAFGEFSGSAGHPSTAWLDSWTPENTNASMPRVAESRKSPSEASNVMSDFWVINTSYLRLKTLQLGYTLPKSVLNAIGLSNVRVYYSAENLFTIDSMPLNVDPETVSSRLSSYPLVMTNSFGVNVTF